MLATAAILSLAWAAPIARLSRTSGLWLSPTTLARQAPPIRAAIGSGLWLSPTTLTRQAPPIRAAIGSVPRKELQAKFDLIVVGGGPAGVAGALKGAYMGKRVLIVDRPKAAPAEGGLDYFFGGPTGLFSKALRDSAKALDTGSLEAMGLDRDVIFKQVQNSCLRLARNNAQTQVEMLRKFKVAYLQGEATLALDCFNGRTEHNDIGLRVRQHAQPSTVIDVTADKVLLCTGSYATRLKEIPFDGVRILESDSVNAIDFLPRSVVVAGSGIIAIEMANIFRKLGAEVTMVVRGTAKSALDRIGIDETIAERLLRGLRDQEVRVLENTVVDSFSCLECDTEERAIGGEDCGTVIMDIETRDAAGELQPAGTLQADLYLSCLGRKPRARGTSLELEANGVKLTERAGHIIVDETFQTTQPGVYAAGDCIEGPALASTGVDQAQRAVAAMFTSCRRELDAVTQDSPFPIGVWTIPEVGYYGMTLSAAQAAGYDAEVGIATYDACLRGRVFAPDGMLKLVFDRDSAVILGVHIIGTDACELVHYGMDLVAKRATLFDVIGTLFTAVTFHELFKEAALNGNEKLDFGIEWQEVLSQLQASTCPSGDKQPEEVELRAAFDAIDTSGDGSLDAEELVDLFGRLAEEDAAPITPGLIANLIRLADDDGNGTIEWAEFLKIFKILGKMQRKQAAEEAKLEEMCSTVDAIPAAAAA